MASSTKRRTLTIGGTDVAFSIEEHLWICFEDIARSRATTAEQLAQSIAPMPAGEHLASTIRTYVLAHFRRESRAPEDGGPIEFEAADADDAATDDVPPRWLN